MPTAHVSVGAVPSTPGLVMRVGVHFSLVATVPRPMIGGNSPPSHGARLVGVLVALVPVHVVAVVDVEPR